MKKILVMLASALMIFASCSEPQPQRRIEVIFDTDANNELDDQHALAYLLFNEETFNIRSIITNNTGNGGGIEGHQAEAERVMRMCNRNEKYPLIKGAEKNFEEIKDDIDNPEFDGHAAVHDIIATAIKHADTKLNIIAVGKLTNVALALYKEPSIADNIRVIWLGSNYPKPGEYNMVNDIPAMNYVLDCDTQLEIVPARYNEKTGTDWVRESRDNILTKMPGLGPKCEPVEGRHGGEFTCFGDYSVDLFKNARCYGNPPSRALFDMACVAIVKNPEWAEVRRIPAPIYENDQWVERPENGHKVFLWENFNKEEILKDFYRTLENSK